MRRLNADARLRGGARGRNGGVREELAVGVKGADRPAGGSIQNVRWFFNDFNGFTDGSFLKFYSRLIPASASRLTATWRRAYSVAACGDAPMLTPSRLVPNAGSASVLDGRIYFELTELIGRALLLSLG